MEQIFQPDKRNDRHQKWPTNVSRYEGKLIINLAISKILRIREFIPKILL